MAAFHISVAEAARDFARLMERVRAGAEFVIDDGAGPAVVLRAEGFEQRTISESIALLEARSKERGYAAVMDADFAANMEEIIANRRPADRSAWE